MDKNRVELKVIGIAVSQKQQEMFALLLEEVNGVRHIPVVIASPEAHAIAIQLEGVVPQRPLTHDVLCDIVRAANTQVDEVVIYKYQDNVFFAELVLVHGNSRFTVQSRTSDAVAIALRMECPIYTTSEVIDQTGVVFETLPNAHIAVTDKKEQTPNEMSEEELQKELKQAVTHEAYERAAEIKNELNKRKQGN